MHIASFLRQVALGAALTALACPAGAGPEWASTRGKPDEVPIGRPPPDNEAPPKPNPTDDDQQPDNGGATTPGDSEGSGNARDPSRGLLSVRQLARIDLSNQCRQRTRSRARITAQSAGTRALVRTILRRR